MKTARWFHGLFVVVMGLTISIAQAEENAPRPDDEIVLQIRAEGWVKTSTARIIATVETVLSGKGAIGANERVPAVLKELAKT